MYTEILKGSEDNVEHPESLDFLELVHHPEEQTTRQRNIYKTTSEEWRLLGCHTV
jgi:hypothetical protein